MIQHGVVVDARETCRHADTAWPLNMILVILGTLYDAPTSLTAAWKRPRWCTKPGLPSPSARPPASCNHARGNGFWRLPQPSMTEPCRKYPTTLSAIENTAESCHDSWSHSGITCRSSQLSWGYTTGSAGWFSARAEQPIESFVRCPSRLAISSPTP